MDKNPRSSTPEPSSPTLVAFRTDGIGHRLSDDDRRAKKHLSRVSAKMVALSADIAETFDLGDRFDVTAARRTTTLRTELEPVIRELRLLLEQHEATLARAEIESAGQVWDFYRFVKALVICRPDDDRLAMMVDELRRLVADSGPHRRKAHPPAAPGDPGGS